MAQSVYNVQNVPYVPDRWGSIMSKRSIANAAFSAVMWLSLPAYGADRATLKEERQVLPACVGIKDGAEWAKCMERFKDVRPQHPPTKLMFGDWRNP